MADTEWWQRGSIDGIPPILQPIAHLLLQVRESVGEIVEPLTEQEWNARGNLLSTQQFAAIQSEGQEVLTADVATVLDALSTRVDSAAAELRTIDVTTRGNVCGVGRAQLPSSVIGCLVHGAEHAMRHVGQLSVTPREVRSGSRG